jgi:YD repeat-containing protein
MQVDPASNVVSHVFDEASRQTATIQYLSSGQITTTRKLDANGRLIGLIDAGGGTTRFTYDLQDRQISTIYPLDSATNQNPTSTWDYSGFDAATGPLKFTDCNGSIFQYSHDGLGRRTGLTVTPAAGVAFGVTQAWEYDGLSRQTMAFDQDAATGTSTDGKASIQYDSLGRVKTETNVGGFSVTYDNFYDLVPQKVNYPNSREINWAYDKMYRLILVKEADTKLPIVKWRFVGPGRLIDATFGNGIACRYRNDGATASAAQASDTAPAWGDACSDHLGYDGAGRMIGKRYFGPGIGIGQYPYMTLQAVAQNSTGWDFTRAEADDGQSPTADFCGGGGQYLYQARQMASKSQTDWDVIRAHPSS